MNRAFAWINLLGVLILGVLCILQWRLNRMANLESFRLEKIRMEQSEKISQQDKTIQGQAADLQNFREQITSLSGLLKEAEARLGALEDDVRQLTAERNQLKVSVTNWAAAVAARDEQLKEASQQLQEVARGRNEAVLKFNDLAEKYNGVVKELNEARVKLGGTPSP